MDLTLNDFRSILGRVNDGNVVFTRENNERTGIEKANYGAVVTRNVQRPTEAKMKGGGTINHGSTRENGFLV
jgi:hypothetical protein